MFRLVSVAAAALFLVATPALAAKIGVLMSTEDVFLQQIRMAIEAHAAKKQGVELEVARAEGDADRQMQQFNAMVEAGVDAMIVNPVVDESSVPMQALAAEKGIPLVYVNRMPPQNRFKGAVSLVSSNEIVAGRLQARILAHMSGGTGNLVLLRGEDGHPAAAGRTQGVKEVLEYEPGITVVHEATGNWNRDDAEKVVAGVLAKGIQIDMVSANNDEMAIGAINAFKNANLPLDNVLIAGVDGTKPAREMMEEGSMTFTLLQDGIAQAERAVDNAVTMANGGYAEEFDWIPYSLILP